jgi:hypothetical protein
VDTSLGDRIVELSSKYSTAKEFLEICEINNYSLITELKKGRIKNPNAQVIAKIVRGTGCSGTWLLTGKGEMFEPRSNTDEVVDRDPLIIRALTLLDRLEQSNGLEGVKLPEDFEVRLTQLLLKVLQHRLER